MNVIYQIVETVSTASSLCVNTDLIENLFFSLKYNNSNSSTGECVWINGEQNSQRQESVQQHWPPTPQAESRQLAQCQHVGAWVDSACMSVHDSFVIDGQNSNRI